MLPPPKTLLMGIVNVTPDSFSDGGQFLDPQQAIDHGLTLLSEGADILDIGAESTRPGAEPVPPDEEWRRLEPVLKGLRAQRPDALISLDSRQPETILKALPVALDYINNVAGIAPMPVLEAIAEQSRHQSAEGGRPLRYIAMHMWRDPERMMTEPLSASDALTHVRGFYDTTVQQLTAAGLDPKEQILLDPGIGFGKTDGGNLQLLRDCLYAPNREKMVVGISRKSMMGRLLGIEEPKARDMPSKMFELALLMAGVHAIRTHDIRTLHTLRKALHKSP